ncbi:hypothetical protein BHM03_00044534 [Ensete ventricosum]|nr:hypothetical protein BHM03_00044534 [Ensete ventricosum]
MLPGRTNLAVKNYWNQGYRYADRPLPGGSVKNRPSAVDFGRQRSIEEEIDRRRSIEREIDCRRSIEEEKWKKRKRKKKKRGRKNTSPACRRRQRVTRDRGRFFSRARRQSVSPRRETNRGDSNCPNLEAFGKLKECQ